MKLNRIADFALKALCDAMMPDDDALEQKSPYGERRRPLLRLVK
jgi:hypothetical protein